MGQIDSNISIWRTLCPCMHSSIHLFRSLHRSRFQNPSSLDVSRRNPKFLEAMNNWNDGYYPIITFLEYPRFPVVWFGLKDLSFDTFLQHFSHMFRAPKLWPFNVKQWLFLEKTSDLRTMHSCWYPYSRDHSKESHFDRLYLWLRSFGHYPTLRKLEAEYSSGRVKGIIKHLLFRNTLKLYVKTNGETLVNIIKVFRNDIKMKFGISQCETVVVRERGKHKSNVTEDWYKYLRVLESSDTEGRTNNEKKI